MPPPRDLNPGASPAHFFGAEVRRAREAAGMTLADLGARVPCDVSTVSRVESGQIAPSGRFASTCDEAFPHMDGWFTRFYANSRRWTDTYPTWFTDWLDAERRAVVLKWWEPLLIPGLLQTEDYARALFSAWHPTGDAEKIDHLVTARIDRQSVFTRTQPPSLWAVLDEGALRRCIGSPKIMHDQLMHLIEVTERTPGACVHVVPSDAGAHTGLLGGFVLAGFGDDTPGIAYFESPEEVGMTVRAATAVARMSLKFDTLRSDALSRRDSRELIMKAAEDYGSTDMA